MACIILGTDARDMAPRDGDYFDLDSPRAGGRYQLTGSAQRGVMQLSEERKTRLTTWLVKQRRAGVKVPVIDTNVVADLDKLTPLKMSARVDAAMLALAKELPRIGQWLRLDHVETLQRALRLMAETASVSMEDLDALLVMISERGLLKRSGENPLFSISPHGWDRIEELEAARPST